MVDISKIQKKEETILIAARMPKKYIEKLKEKDIGITRFILKAFEETFGELK